MFIIRALGGYPNILFNSCRSIISIILFCINEIYNLLACFFHPNKQVHPTSWLLWFFRLGYWDPGYALQPHMHSCFCIGYLAVLFFSYSVSILTNRIPSDILLLLRFYHILCFFFWARMLLILTNFTHRHIFHSSTRLCKLAILNVVQI